MHTTDTRARIWDIDGRHGQGDAIINDDGVHKVLADLASFRTLHDSSGDRQPPKGGTKAIFILITTVGDPIRSDNPVRMSPATLQSVLNMAGVSATRARELFSGDFPICYTILGYDKDGKTPASITFLFRCPRNSSCLLGAIKIELSTRDCFMFLTSPRAENTIDIKNYCQKNIEALRMHPLYVLSYVFSQRYQSWSNWCTTMRREIAEIETVTNMTRPGWAVQAISDDRKHYLSNADNMLRQLHAINVELCYSHTVVKFAFRFGEYCLRALDEVEGRRAELWMSTLAPSDRITLEEEIKGTMMRCEAMQDKLHELSARLNGQINVSYNLIAQKDSKINFAIAKLQAHDSQTVKAIAILTLLFLPTTWLATLWTTNLFEMKGEKNWHVFLAASLLLTLVVLSCWVVYGHVSRSQEEARWPPRAAANMLSFDSQV